MCIIIFRAFEIENEPYMYSHSCLFDTSGVNGKNDADDKKVSCTEAFDFTSAVDLDLINRLYLGVCNQKKKIRSPTLCSGSSAAPTPKIRPVNPGI